MQIVQLAKAVTEYNVDLVKDLLKEVMDKNQLFPHPLAKENTTLLHLAVMLPPWSTESKKKKKAIIDLVKESGVDYLIKDGSGVTPLFALKRKFGWGRDVMSPLKQLVADVEDDWYVMDMDIGKFRGDGSYDRETFAYWRQNDIKEQFTISRLSNEKGHVHIGSKEFLGTLSSFAKIETKEVKVNDTAPSKDFFAFYPPKLDRKFFKNSTFTESGKTDYLVLEKELPTGEIFLLDGTECIIVKKSLLPKLKKLKDVTFVPALGWCSFNV